MGFLMNTKKNVIWKIKRGITMDIFILYEENHGFQCVSRTLSALLKWAYYNWIAFDFYPWNQMPIKDVTGKTVTKENLKEVVCSMTLEQFNDAFDGWLAIETDCTID